MYLPNFLASLVSAASLLSYAAADLRITADNHSFGGVNFPQLQFLEPSYRNEVIRSIVKTNARVIRLFIRGDGSHGDPEPWIGEFDKTLLDQFDDTLAAIHRISKGQVKVIIAPHDAHALRGSNDVPCDAYCKKLDGAFLDFYSSEEYRKLYKTRLDVFFKHYPSKNFGGKSWSKLNEVILGVDVQNEPWSGIWPIVAGEGWLCDIANHLKDNLGLGSNNIAVISGGISGPQTEDGVQNFPDSAFECAAIDVIGIHGYFAQGRDQTAGTPWANIFLPGNTLTARAKGKKLLLVEEWAFSNTELGLNYKRQALFDQGNALNYRGIPWIYSQLTIQDEGTTSKVSIVRESRFAIGALADALRHAYKSRSNFDWSKYISAPPTGLTNNTLLPLNPYIPGQSGCVFGCEGFLCDAADGCSSDLICKNSVCQEPSEKQPGKVGDQCNSKKLCQEHLLCEDGLCQQCDERPTIQPDAYPRKKVVYNDPNGQCHLDTDRPFRMRPYCKLPSSTPRGNPCISAASCDANEFCDWGLCKPCTEGCLGMKCRSNNKCKTGFCNAYGRCDYPGKPKLAHGPGGHKRGSTNDRRGPGWNAGPKNQERGPNKVRDEAMRINIPKEQVEATGKPAATA